MSNAQLLASLRTEIVETQKTGADFIKWKLIATAAVASLALGVGQTNTPPDRDLLPLLCLIPLICAYVDLMSADLAIRILSIAAFLRQQGDVYECWVGRRRSVGWRNPFGLAPMAVHGSSVAMNALILLLVLFGDIFPKAQKQLFVAASVGGLIVAVLLWYVYWAMAKKLSRWGNCPTDSDG